MSLDHRKSYPFPESDREAIREGHFKEGGITPAIKQIEIITGDKASFNTGDVLHWETNRFCLPNKKIFTHHTNRFINIFDQNIFGKKAEELNLLRVASFSQRNEAIQDWVREAIFNQEFNKKETVQKWDIPHEGFWNFIQKEGNKISYEGSLESEINGTFILKTNLETLKFHEKNGQLNPLFLLESAAQNLIKIAAKPGHIPAFKSIDFQYLRDFSENTTIPPQVTIYFNIKKEGKRDLTVNLLLKNKETKKPLVQSQFTATIFATKVFERMLKNVR